MRELHGRNARPLDGGCEHVRAGPCHVRLDDVALHDAEATTAPAPEKVGKFLHFGGFGVTPEPAGELCP